jgi:hypothetical protein
MAGIPDRLGRTPTSGLRSRTEGNKGMADNQTATVARDAEPSKMLKFLVFQLGRLKFALRILGVDDIVALNRYDEAETVFRTWLWKGCLGLQHSGAVASVSPRVPA